MLVAAVAVALLAALAWTAPASAIVGGNPQNFPGAGTYPFVGAITDHVRFGLDAHARQYCGGSLIAPRLFLTAAHCIENPPIEDPDNVFDPSDDVGGDGTSELDPNDIQVVLGRTTLSEGGGVVRNAVALDPLPGFELPTPSGDTNPDTWPEDAGLVVLDAPAPGPYARIAGEPYRTDFFAPQRIGAVFGWGVTEDGGRSDVLRAAYLPLVDDAQCAATYSYPDSGFAAYSHFCAGYYDSDSAQTCPGDSGGPLFAYQFDYDWVLIGLIHGGKPCRQPFPDVFQNITSARFCNLLEDRAAALESRFGLPHTDIVLGGCPLRPIGLPGTPPPTGDLNAQTFVKVKKGSGFLDLACPPPTNCDFKVDFLATARGSAGPGTVLGTARGSVPPATTGPVPFKLTKAGRKRLKKRRTVPIALEGTRTQGGVATPVTGTTKLRGPKRKKPKKPKKPKRR